MTGKPIVLSLALLLGSGPGEAADWPEWRGPNRDGISHETNLIESWSPAGENLLWKAPYPGRSTPIVMGDRLYAFNGAGDGAELQERVICLNADTGELIWEYRHNVVHSDAPPWRIAWSSPVGDPETGNVYAFGVAGMLSALTRDGEVLWQRSLIEEFGTLSTHGGRTVSPVIDGDLVIVSSVSSGWGNQAGPGYRFWAFDKRTGECVWVGTTGARPYDTTYSTPLLLDVNGTRLLVSGTGDGGVHALKSQTGELVWSYPMSKRGVNTEVVARGNTVFVSHGEENLDTSEMGLLAAVDATAEGAIALDAAKWKIEGFLGGYSSPVVDGDVVYQIDNSSNLHAFDAMSGEELWVQNLGTIQKASPVFADGKIYVGNENGKFYILRPSREGCEILDEDQLGTEEIPEIITASPAVSNGRFYVVTDSGMYAFGKKLASEPAASRPAPAMGEGSVAWVQVVPTELVLSPGARQEFRARLFDAKGRFLRNSEASWSLDTLPGVVDELGNYQVPATIAGGAGVVKATVEGVTGAARVRVVPPLPWAEDFEDLPAGGPPPQWVSATGKFQIREVDGNKVLVKLANNPATQRTRVMMGPTGWHDYTVELDMRASEQRRQMGDAGPVAQRYTLALFGSHQKLDVFPWQADPSRTVSKPFGWQKDTWYRMKLRVESQDGGKTRVLGKVWPVAESEPAAWTIDHVENTGNHEGSVGLFANAPYEIFFDNLKVTPNE